MNQIDRTTLILIFLLVLLMFGGGYYLYLFQQDSTQCKLAPDRYFVEAFAKRTGKEIMCMCNTLDGYYKPYIFFSNSSAEENYKKSLVKDSINTSINLISFDLQ